jgi:Xaa-Pro aminopeptidase
MPDDQKPLSIDELHARSGSELGVAEFSEAIARAAAAPPAWPADGWIDLIAPGADADVRAALMEARAAQEPVEGAARPQRVAALRARLKEIGIDGFIVPRSDEHLGEFVPADSERLAWLTGFTGSAGLAVVMAETAALFIDGRYTLQVRDQADADIFEFRHLIREPATDWLREKVQPGMQIGFDARLHGIRSAAALRDAVEAAGGVLAALDVNPLDEVWEDRPLRPLSPAVPHPLEFAGEPAEAKRQRIAEAVAGTGAVAAVLSQPESIAWLLNIRGQDTESTPLPLCHAIQRTDGSVELFIDALKVTPALRGHLGAAVNLLSPERFGPALAALGDAGAKVLIDPNGANEWIRLRLAEAGAEIIGGEDPCILPRAIKNEIEIAGTIAAHNRDGAALSRFLHWLDDNAPGVSELDCVDRLAAFREEMANYRGPSFSTIAGSGPNGAIVHYRVTERTDRTLGAGELFLVDSGGQYLDGTTDVTRTIAIGAPSAEMRRAFTLVLKGHISLATARFPAGTKGGQLDGLARQHLWRHGLNYDHGTGHGVGSYLGVHEGPQRIGGMSAVDLLPGMIVSNEPGYYKTGAFGIRIENLVLVEEADIGEDGGWLGFRTLTLAPIDRRLVDLDLMDRDEIAWLDSYHAEVARVVGPQLDGAAADWLRRATAPLGS